MANGAFRNWHPQIYSGLAKYEEENETLIGIVDPKVRGVLVEQLVSSLRRIEYVHLVQKMKLHPDRCCPHNKLFDPLLAAIIHRNNGDYDEAIWLAFLATHFGKSSIDKWKLAKNVYGTFNLGPVWTYSKFRNSQGDFLNAMQSNRELLNDPNYSGRYSNHRKYESKRPNHIFKVLSSFCNLLSTNSGFRGLIESIHKEHGQCPAVTFHQLYRQLDQVSGFGRLAKFDYLTMIGIGKLDLAPILPNSTYISESSGPKAGANLLFFGSRHNDIKPKDIEFRADNLSKYLNVEMQVIEDALCNWQKSPNLFVYHR